MEETFILQVDDVFIPTMKVNPRGFTRKELEEYISLKGLTEYTVISIDKEIEKYRLQGDPSHKDLMDVEVYNYDTWFNAFLDNNINGFSLPVTVSDNEEYIAVLKDKFNQYCKVVTKPAFVYEKGLVSDIRQNCDDILAVLQLLIDYKVAQAEELLKNFIDKFREDSFIVNELDNSYSFRGIAPFIELRSDGYENLYERMNNEKLTFFRARTRKKGDNENISECQHMLHLPYEKKEKASAARFSRVGVPCLYLGTTSYVCSRECDWIPDEEELFAASFIPNERGSKLKVLNLTISQALINGIYNKHVGIDNVKKGIQNSMLKIFPLVIATSFRINEKDRKRKYEYLISQALMKVISQSNIDGIAYLSMKGKNEFQYPHGVNLTLPAFDISENKPYSQYCEMFDVTAPVLFNYQVGNGKRSYINAIYERIDVNGQESFMSMVDVEGQYKFYGDIQYADFDNFLVSQNKAF